MRIDIIVLFLKNLRYEIISKYFLPTMIHDQDVRKITQTTFQNLRGWNS